MIEWIDVDQDGVLADFIGGVSRLHGRENPYASGENVGVWDIWTLWGITEEQFWAPTRGPEFWANLEPLPGAQILMHRLEAAVGRDNIRILTTPSRDPMSLVGKLQWIERHFPEYARSYSMTPKKKGDASPRSLLVDDYWVNCWKYVAAGGVAFMYPGPHNSRATLDMDSVLRMLGVWLPE